MASQYGPLITNPQLGGYLERNGFRESFDNPGTDILRAIQMIYGNAATSRANFASQNEGMFQGTLMDFVNRLTASPEGAATTARGKISGEYGRARRRGRTLGYTQGEGLNNGQGQRIGLEEAGARNASDASIYGGQEARIGQALQALMQTMGTNPYSDNISNITQVLNQHEASKPKDQDFFGTLAGIAGQAAGGWASSLGRK